MRQIKFQEIKLLQQEKISQLTASLSDVDINADRLFNEYNDNRKIEQNLDSLKGVQQTRNLPSNQATKRKLGQANEFKYANLEHESLKV